VVGIADKGEAGLSSHGIDPAREGFVGHVVLHDVDQRLVRGLLAAGELVECDHVPVAHETNPTIGIVYEELWDRNFTARNQLPVGREFRVDVGLAGALRAQLDQIVVPLNVRDEAEQLEQLAATAKGFRLEADALHQQVDPLIGCEGRPQVPILLVVDLGDLDRLDGLEDPWRDPRILRKLVLHIGDAPHAGDQQFRVGLHRPAIDRDLFDPEVVEDRLIAVGLLVERDADLIDDLVAAFFLDRGLDQPGFTAVHIMLAQYVFDGLNTRLD